MDWLKSSGGPKKAQNQPARSDRQAWTILIVDDEESIHAVTRMALRDFTFSNQPLEFLDAYSGKEAIEIVKSRSDIAIILMDVVMDTDDDGLKAVHTIRNELENHLTRIILRTGHPGQAPEIEIIAKYDIDDYKEKTELTKNRLFTSVYAGIRAYRDLRALERNRQGLETVIKASTHLLGVRGIAEFAQGVLSQLSALLHEEVDGVFARDHGFASLKDSLQDPIIAATGRFDGATTLQDVTAINTESEQRIDTVVSKPGTQFGDGWFAHCIESPSKRRLILYLESRQEWSPLDRRVLKLFSHNVAMGLDNLYLTNQIMDTQRGLVLMLGEAIEMRSMEAGKHVHRVGEFSALLAKLAGLEAEQVDTLRIAAPLHDVGKIAIEDAILNKPGRHTEDEGARMREHAAIGAKLLSGHKLPILDAASQVAAGHHECWDGSGYPAGTKGEETHIYGRIVAITDVFDALCSARCYKTAWPIEQAVAFISERRGTKFDPKLVDLFCDNLDAFKEISQRLGD